MYIPRPSSSAAWPRLVPLFRFPFPIPGAENGSSSSSVQTGFEGFAIAFENAGTRGRKVDMSDGEDREDSGKGKRRRSTGVSGSVGEVEWVICAGYQLSLGGIER